jgi:hypothetical protein
LCVFLWAKGLNAKYINKEIFPVYSGKSLSLKEVHNWVHKFPQGRSKVADDARPGVEVAGTSLKRLLVKRWEKCINIGGGYVEK